MAGIRKDIIRFIGDDGESRFSEWKFCTQLRSRRKREYPFGRNKLAKEIGDWMKINKEAIYGTSHSTVQKQDWGYFTQKGNKLYMCVFNRPINNLLKIEIPKGGIIPMKAYFLENNQETEIQNAGKNKRNSSLYHVAVPASYKTDRPFVIVLEMQENTKEEGEYQQAKI